MFVTAVETFAVGDYGIKNWYSSDAIEYVFRCQVIKRTPKRVTIVELMPNGPHNREYTYKIETDGAGEYFVPNGYIGVVRPKRPEQRYCRFCFDVHGDVVPLTIRDYNYWCQNHWRVEEENTLLREGVERLGGMVPA